MFKKGRFLFFVFIFMMLFNVVSVDAVDLITDGRVCYKKSNGIRTSSCSYYTIYKTFKIDGNVVEAFCTQLNKGITNHSYSKSSDFDSRSKDALVAGKSIELVYSDDDYDSDEKYLYTTEIINYIFDYNGSEDYVSDNSSLKSIYNNAVKAVNAYNFSGNDASKLPAITLKSASSNNMNSTSTTGTYLSNKITLGNLIDNFGGGSGDNNGNITYSASLSGSGTLQFCTDAAGKKCAKTLTIVKPTSTFYVKTTGATAGESVKISVTGSNKSTYPTVTRYESNSGSQKLMVKGNVTFSRTVSKSLTLNIPADTNHFIKVSKVDENGDVIEDGNLELKLYKTKNDVKVGDLNWTTTSNGIFTYSVTNSVDNDDFYGDNDKNKIEYCVEETKSPNGFIKLTKPLCVQAIGTGDICYNENGDDTKDLNYCNAKPKCEDGSSPNSEGKCLVQLEPVDPEIKHNCANGEVINIETNNEVSYKCNVDKNIITNDSGVEESVCPEGSEKKENDDGSFSCLINSEESKVCDESNGWSYNPTNNKCEKTEEKTPLCYVNDTQKVDNKYCDGKSYNLVNYSKGGLSFSFENKPTEVKISKMDITGEKEIPGAKLKICSNKPDKDGKCDAVKLTQKGLSCPSYNDEVDESLYDVFNCTYDKTKDERTISLEWYSSDVSRTWEGLKIGKYYLVEETPPSGYISTTTATEFEIDSNGAVKTGETTVKDGLLVIKNKLSEMTISKADMATSKEVPGATLSICEAYDDENGKVKMAVDDFGECTVATLADGSPATWVSGNEPHKVVGLPIGKYYLVEKIAPKDYDTAESIVFTMRADGKVGDANGKLLDGNKLVMFDKSLKQVPTGDIIVWIVLAVVLAVGSSVGVIIYRKKKLSM